MFSPRTELCSRLTGRPARRVSQACRSFSVESLEPRVVLTREHGVSVLVDAPALIAPIPETAPSPAVAPTVSVQSVTHDRKVERLARAGDDLADIAAWTGTWNVVTTVPALGNGTLQITQNGDDFAVTATGFGGRQFSDFKLRGDDILTFRVNSLAGDPKKITCAIELNVDTLATFVGRIKVSGEREFFDMSATRQQGTAVANTHVLISLAGRTSVKSGATFDFGMVLINQGPGAIPTGGARVTIYLQGAPVTYQHAANIRRHGFETVTPTTLSGIPALICVAEEMVGQDSRAAAVKISLKVGAVSELSSFSITAALADANGSETPPNFDNILSQTVIVQVIP